MHASGRNCSSVLILLASCQQKFTTYTIAVCTVKTSDDGHRNCPKHVEFCTKNKFEKLVNLVGFVIRIYHDVRSLERQNKLFHLFYEPLYLGFQIIYFSIRQQIKNFAAPLYYSKTFTPMLILSEGRGDEAWRTSNTSLTK